MIRLLRKQSAPTADSSQLILTHAGETIVVGLRRLPSARRFNVRVRSVARDAVLTMPRRGLWQPQSVEVGRRQGSHAQTRRDRRTRLRPCLGAWRHAPNMVAGSRKCSQALPRSCRGLESRHFDARSLRRRYAEGGRERQICVPAHHSGRRYNRLRDYRRVRHRHGGAHCRHLLRSRMIKSRHFHRADTPLALFRLKWAPSSTTIRAVPMH